ncbi:oocyte zinc finger protein XlCOF6-like [Malaya genurostris]|uniref:oocyte zinc finger protein XlCOF6-like n=1 Tax=Malaya genurostris TaxID=325434 RepID=UPI0026F38C95|nr:oocyte zinc finger protein XlCOF6-like [Malaya genurostris]
MMESALLYNCCRICLNVEKTFLPLSTEVEYESVTITCMDMYCSVTALNAHDKTVSNKLCINCFSELNNCYRFRSKALESFEKLLKNYHSRNSVNPSINDRAPVTFLDKSYKSSNASVDGNDTESKECFNHKQKLGVDIKTDVTTCEIEAQNDEISLCLEETTDIYEEEFLEIDCVETIQDQYAEPINDHNPNDKAHSDEETNQVTSQPFKCVVCSKQLESQSILDSHFVAEHCQQERRDGNFICLVCKKSFGMRKTLRQHCRIHQKCDLRRFRCSFCHKGFNYGHHLKIHERTHTMEKPFSCGACTKKFASKDRLKNHELQHVENYRHNCESCSSSFRSKKGLRMHAILKHDKAVNMFEPIDCSTCGKALFSQSAASAHFKGPCGTTLTKINKF